MENPGVYLSRLRARMVQRFSKFVAALKVGINAGGRAGLAGENSGNMLDIIFVAAIVLFIGIAILYVRACERLR